MQRLIAALAVVVAFVAGRETSPAVQAQPIVQARPVAEVEREVVAAPAVRCPIVGADVPPAEPADTADVPEDEHPDGAVDDGAVDVAETELVRSLDAEAKHLAALEANIGSRGAIYGTVRDAKTGESLPGVTVLVTARGNDLAAITDETGYYQLTDLDPDTYLMTFYFADVTIERGSVYVAAGKPTAVAQRIGEAFGSGETTIDHEEVVVD